MTKLNMASSTFYLVVLFLVSVRTVEVEGLGGVSIELQAPWPTHRLSHFMETGEFLETIKEDLFWTYVEKVVEETLKKKEWFCSLSREEAYEQSVRLAEESLIQQNGKQSLPILNLLKLSLDLRAFSPAIEQQRQLSMDSLSALTSNLPKLQNASMRTPDAWVLAQRKGSGLETEYLTTQEEVESFLTSCSGPEGTDDSGPSALSIPIFDFDHIYQRSLDDENIDASIVLTGILGTESFAELFQAIISSSCSIRFAIRFSPRISIKVNGADRIDSLREVDDVDVEPITLLSGFGATLDIKNMEYLTINEDDKKDTDDVVETEEDTELTLGHFVGGIDFATILSHYDISEKEKENLLSLRKRLLVEKKQQDAENNELPQLKVWEMKSLGLQTTHHIINSDQPLSVFEDIVHNFPMRAEFLSKIKVPKSLGKAATKAADMMSISSTDGVVLINGKAINVGTESFNIFSLFDTVRQEILLSDSVYALGFQSESAFRQFAQLGKNDFGADDDEESDKGLADGPLRVDIRKGGKGAIVFLNNIEKDAIYAQWPTNLRQLLQPSRQLIPIRKNLYTGVFVIDPSSSDGRRMLQTVMYFLQVGAPIRIGLVFTDRNLISRVREPMKSSTETGDENENDGTTQFDENAPCGAECYLKLYLAAKQAAGKNAALQVLRSIASASPTNTEGISIEDACGVYTNIIAAATGSWVKSTVKEQAIEALKSSQRNEVLIKMAKYVVSKGLPVPSWSINGIISTDSHQIDRELSQVIFKEQQMLAMQVYAKNIKDKTDVLKFLLQQSSTVARYDKVILQPPNEQSFVDVLPHDAIFSQVRQYTLKTHSENAVDQDQQETVEKTDESSEPYVTIWVGVDLTCEKGLDLALSTVQFLQNSTKKLLVSILPLTEESVPMWARIFSSTKSMLVNHVEEILLDVKTSEHSGRWKDAPAELETIGWTLFKGLHGLITSANQRKSGIIHGEESLSTEESKPSGISNNYGVLICNGRMLEINENNFKKFSKLEYEMLLSVENDSRLEKIVSFIKANVNIQLEDGTRLADIVFCTRAFYGVLSQDERQFFDKKSFRKELVLTVPSELSGAGPALDVTVIIDPLSKKSQNIATVLRLLSTYLGAKIMIVFVPNPSISEFPLPNFYRFAAHDASNGNIQENNSENVESLTPALGNYVPSLEFSKLPQSQLLTLKISTPEPWIVYPVDTGGADTDNIRLKNDGSVNVQFALKSLLVTGHCYNINTGAPPAGLQLELKTTQQDTLPTVPEEDKEICVNETLGTCSPHSSVGTVISDTLVMNNLGYFQLRANPGVWTLQLARGNSRDIYRIAESRSSAFEPSASVDVNDGVTETVVIRDFLGKVETLPMQKREGMENAELLDDLDKLAQKVQGDASGSQRSEKGNGGVAGDSKNEGGIWSTITNTIMGVKKDPSALGNSRKESEDTIHVFSVASGALYERFLRIMMVSVVSNTSQKVKFWIIENFLQPSFKETLPILAEAYGFEYDLVTYKWPHWLRRQTEKQRIIWGYKILFLDVLFPLDVPKVIYVDADQVVRADLKELWNMDLQGMPYGFTPFCDSRKETLGFQFWRSGYWHDHLQGRPYHISALFVVDLVAFRRMAVGDKLRAVYDSLSRDPNSLANLDQDLPNYAQHAIPIFSLPQEWLWCESWCSDASKTYAKTIDLCNNPLHKEPKLDMAKRVISGQLFEKSWVEMDDEIKKIISEGMSKKP